MDYQTPNTNNMPNGKTYAPYTNVYYNPYTGYYSPTTAQMYPTPNNQQVQGHPYIKGRLVSSAEEITPNEVLMDGSVSLFPKNDYSEIYAKSWDRDGHLITVKFVREDTKPIQEQTVNMDDILNRLDAIERKLFRKPATNKGGNQNGD